MTAPLKKEKIKSSSATPDLDRVPCSRRSDRSFRRLNPFTANAPPSDLSRCRVIPMCQSNASGQMGHAKYFQRLQHDPCHGTRTKIGGLGAPSRAAGVARIRRAGMAIAACLDIIRSSLRQWQRARRSVLDVPFSTVQHAESLGVLLKLRRLFATLSLTVLSIPVHAAGCLKGAAVGGVAGHVAGHHAVAGAAIGCAVGHHEASVKAKDAAQQRAATPNQAPSAPQNGSPNPAAGSAGAPNPGARPVAPGAPS